MSLTNSEELKTNKESNSNTDKLEKKTNLIKPDMLEADAVVPQCLDNQYVSDDVFDYMIKKGVDYNDKTVSKMREKEIKTEFMRSLVYSSQTVIQRAYLVNNPFLFKNYLPSKKNQPNIDAMAQLISKREIIPFLWTETSLRDFLDNPPFELHPEGKKAVENLLEEVDDKMDCVRLDIEQPANERKIKLMDDDFSAYLTRLKKFDETQIKAVANEVFVAQKQSQDDETIKRFSDSLKELARFAFEADKLSRSIIYKNYFVVDNEDEKKKNENVALGRFKKPDNENPFVIEHKKYVDLIYNTNLPDALDRYTFTPSGMPTRMALQDSAIKNAEYDEIEKVFFDKRFLRDFHREIRANYGRLMNVPWLNRLTVADIVKIRGLKQWKDFKNAQIKFLSDPKNIQTNLIEFDAAFNAFQSEFSDWYYKDHRLPKVEKHISTITYSLTFGGVAVIIGNEFIPQIPSAMGHLLHFGAAAIETVSRLTTENLKSYAIKICFNVFEKTRNRLTLDKSRSHKLEIRQRESITAREELKALLNKLDKAKIPFVVDIAKTADVGTEK